MGKIYLNYEVKISTIILSSLLIIFLIVQGMFFISYRNNQKQDYIDIIGSVISKAIEIDPKLEKELIPLVTKDITEEDKGKGTKVLDEYGVTVDLSNSIFPNIQKNNGAIIVTIVFSFALLILNYIQYNIYFKKVRSLTLASNKIIEDDYSIVVKENNEGDFAKLSLAFSNIRRIIKNNITSTQQEKEHLVELLQNISHQFKTRISTMLLYNDILLNRKLTEEQRVNFLKDNYRQLGKLNEMIQNILKLAKLDASAIEFYKRDDNLNKTLEEVIESLNPLAKDNNINLSLKLNNNIIFKHDRFWMQEALTNIIKNCIEHTLSNGEVKIELTETPIYYKITVEDSGEGIEGDEIPKIFSRFYKAKNSRKKDSVGIGLAISKSIVEGQEGYIDVKSQKGKGTTFIITFMKF
ncbi:HAMP domain-containing sensor histidine kinase [Clostridium sp. UBA7503]|uniref:sensor histidine kinase n=1 Tax=Clostridium sp. UBA7503 TaxID=1946377 RepID=UPI0032176152